MERVFRLLCGRVQQELRHGVVPLDSDLGLECWGLIQPNHRHTVHRGKHLPGDHLEEVFVRVIPEHDPLFIEEFLKSFGDLLGVHYADALSCVVVVTPWLAGDASGRASTPSNHCVTIQ